MIVTATLDAAAFAKLDAERRVHFPPERNFLSAHLTLFHALPNDPDVRRAIEELCLVTPSIAARASSMRSLGRGVAYVVEAPALVRFRDSLASTFVGRLTNQDAQKLSPHVTIQNKVTPDAARALLETKRASFEPFAITVSGVSLWHYRDGPWERIEDLTFSAAVPAAP